MQLLNALTGWQWALAATIPFGIVALYFLKLKRQPLRVPSTFLWQKSIEDLHVNSLFQRLRKNLLLFLQLLVVALALVALARPAWLGGQSGGQRHVIVIDNSASMAAVDVTPNRLEAAKQSARTDVIDRMAGDDAAMIITFNDSAHTLQPYTSNRQLLRQKLDSIQVTNRRTNLREALELAGGLANQAMLRDKAPPSTTAELAAKQAGGDAQDASGDIGAPHLHLFTDGGFPDIENFALGSLEPHYYAIGKSNSNVGIVAMMVRRNDERPDQLQVFARLKNFGADSISGRSELYLDNELRDASDFQVDGGTEQAVKFDLLNLDQGVIELRLDVKDLLASDNRAWCVVGSVRRAKVLVVTRGNRWFELALKTEAAQSVADIRVMTPDVLATDDYKGKAATGQFDLVVYDECVPEEMPQSNTLFFGTAPKHPALGEPRKQVDPIFASVNDSNPLFRFISMENVIVRESTLPEIASAAGAEILLESNEGPLAYLLSREGFSDCVLGFTLERDGEKGRELNTDWFLQPSFPLFVFNALRVLGNVQDALSEETVLPGQTVVLRSESLAKQMRVKDPGQTAQPVQRTPQGSFIYNNTEALGVYEFGDPEQRERVERRFAVNLFDVRESDIAPRPEVQIGHNAVTAREAVNRTRKEAWRWMVGIAFAVLLGEWYVYNRRVYI